MPADVLTRFSAELPREHQLTLVSTIVSNCSESLAYTEKRYSARFPKAHAIGVERYYSLQDKLLQLNLPGLVARSEKHPGGSTFYTALETAGLRMTVRKLLCRHENPPPTLFRMTEQAKQLSFALGDKLIAEISYGFDANILEAPHFVDVRFPDGEGGYLEDTIDLLDLLREPIPEEVVEEKRDTKLRDRRTSKPNFIA